jgi:hypothetical protein
MICSVTGRKLEAKSITILWDDGSTSEAKDQWATEIWRWVEACQTMAYCHGMIYKGEKMQRTTALGEVV